VALSRRRQTATVVRLIAYVHISLFVHEFFDAVPLVLTARSFLVVPLDAIGFAFWLVASFRSCLFVCASTDTKEYLWRARYLAFCFDDRATATTKCVAKSGSSAFGLGRRADASQRLFLSLSGWIHEDTTHRIV
jgi:hypothetical protein